MDDCVHTKSHPTLCDPMDCSQPNSSIHGILQARKLDWVALPSSMGSSQPRDRNFISYVSCISRQVFFYHQYHNGSTHFGGDSVQFSLVTQSCPTLCDPMDCRMPGFPVHYQLLEPAQTHVHRVGDASYHLILYSPLLLQPSIFPSIRVFSSESVLCITWPEYWHINFSISTSSEYSGLISFRMDWLDLFEVQGAFKSLLQHHRLKASILQCSAFLIVQLSHPYMTTGKTIAWTRQTFVGKVMSLLFNMLSRLIIVFLPRSKHFLT